MSRLENAPIPVELCQDFRDIIVMTFKKHYYVYWGDTG